MLAELKLFTHQFARSLTPPYHLVRWKVKWRGLMRQRDQRIADYLAAPGAKMLQVGCGNNRLPGWLNTDITHDEASVVYLDATRAFPLPSATFDYVFSEHMIEHVSYEGGAAMLRECLRVLKPGGRLRVATPNLRNILSLYTESPSDVQRRYVRWSVDRHTPGRREYDAAHVINTFLTSWGHTFVYDVTTLTRQMHAAGFVDVCEHLAEQSDDPNLRDIEMHGREIGSVEMNELETMVLEAVKPLE